MGNTKTKIVATVGPACNQYEQLLDLVKTGVNVFRLNMSHGAHEEHAQVIEHIKRINIEENCHVAILADLQGPKLRVGKIKDGAISLHLGQHLYFTNELIEGTEEAVYISYPNFHEDVKVGEKILLDDGKMEVQVVQILPDGRVEMEVTVPGILSSNKGVNLPETNVSLPSLTEKDLRDLQFLFKHEIDWIALSFVRKPEDVHHLKKLISDHQSTAKVIAKIEKPEALNCLREVILASDAIMVARGDLGVELPLEKVPMIQRKIVRMCIHRAKPVIIATQMMESMITLSRPYRSEITDVANAVMEGADAVMLSGETAVGKHPQLVIKTMVEIIKEVEKEELVYNKNLVPQPHSPSFLSDALCYNACEIAQSTRANAIIGMTQSGYTAFMLSSFRPQANLYVFTKTPSLINQLSLSWGVHAFFYDKEENIDLIIQDQIDVLKSEGLVQIGDVVVNTGSIPVNEHLPTNMLKVSRVK